MRVAVALLDGMWSFDVSSVIQVFAGEPVFPPDSNTGIDFISGGAYAHLDHGISIATTPFEDADRPDAIIVPGFALPLSVANDGFPIRRAELPQVSDVATCNRMRDWILRWHAAGVEIASSGTGAFFLGWAGLLKNTPCTAPWTYAMALQRLYPTAKVNDRVLYVHEPEEHLWTAAGGSACVDLCLALIENHFGTAVTASVTRSMILHHLRPAYGLQATRPVLSDGDIPNTEVDVLKSLIRGDLSRRWTVSTLASSVHLSPRTLQRRFAHNLGISVGQWLLDERLAVARELLETTTMSVARISRKTGFGSDDLLRKHFAAIYGMSPREYRSQRAAPELSGWPGQSGRHGESDLSRH